MNTEPINDYIRQLEKDLLEAKRLLRSGLDVSLAQLAGATQQVKQAMRSEVKAKLKALEVLAEDAIDKIEERVGRLNYLAAEQEVKSLEAFNRLAEPLAKSLHQARATIAKLDEIGQREFAALPGDIATAWHDLHLYIEIVRLELSLAENHNEEGIATVRAQLVEQFEQAAAAAAEARQEHEATSLVERLWKGVREVAHGASESLSTFFSAAKRPGESPGHIGDAPE
jgi:hypothetical protein